jgi:hypothetical protein
VTVYALLRRCDEVERRTERMGQSKPSAEKPVHRCAKSRGKRQRTKSQKPRSKRLRSKRPRAKRRKTKRKDQGQTAKRKHHLYLGPLDPNNFLEPTATNIT